MDANEHKYQYGRLSLFLSLSQRLTLRHKQLLNVNGCMRFGSVCYDWIGQGVANEKIYNKINEEKRNKNHSLQYTYLSRAFNIAGKEKDNKIQLKTYTF